MKKKKKKPLVIIMALIMALSSSVVSQVSAQTGLRATTDFNELSINYVKFRSPKLSECTFESTNPNVKLMEYRDDTRGMLPHIVYQGPLTWGTKNRTSTANASLGTTNVAGTVKLRAKDMAILPDGSMADLELTLSGWKILTGPRPSGVSAGQTLYTCIMDDALGMLSYKTTNPKTSPSSKAGIATTIAQRITTQVRVLQSGTDEPIDQEKYPKMLIGWRDLDVDDKSIAYGKSSAARYAGTYSEGIGIISGFDEVYAVTPGTNTTTQIVDGVQKIRGAGGLDSDTLNSGGYFSVSPQGYSYFWYGSRHPSAAAEGDDMGSRFMGSPEVSVLASSGDGGTIEKEGATSYILNGNTTYDYTPDEGYAVSSLTVNGEAVAFAEEGGTYEFPKLLELNQSGHDYTIDVQFRKAAWKIDTSVVNGRITESETGIPEGENRVITYSPDEGYQLRSVTVDDRDMDINEYPSSYAFNNITEDHNIRVEYEKTPAIEVEKTADRQVYNAGDRVTYTIKVKQTVEGAEARDLSIRDVLPQGLSLETDSITGPVQVVSAETGSYELKIDSLAEEVVYTYTALTDREIEGTDLENIVTVTASNIPGDPREARAKISTLKPKPVIDKIVSNETPVNGEEITYTISAKEPKEGIVVRNAVIRDEIPEGIELIEGSIVTEGDEATAEFAEGILTVTVPLLSAETVVSFRAKARAKDGEVVNVATLTGDDIEEKRDDAVIKVKGPQPILKKTAVTDPEPQAGPEPPTPEKEKEPDRPSSIVKTGDEAGQSILPAIMIMLAALMAGLMAYRIRRDS